ncbi:hypothetical protein BDW60DRAFT_180306 [Aspergillus nidulans var. acristatus]
MVGVAVCLQLHFVNGLLSWEEACDSCSRKLDHNSASDSLLAAPLSRNSVAKLGVLGVRCMGEPGTRSLAEAPDAPGRARPACSRCSERCQCHP